MAHPSNAELAGDEMGAWTSGDFDRVRTLVSDDVTFRGAMGTTSGVDAYVEGLTGLAQIVAGVGIHRVFADGDDVSVIYDLQTRSGESLPCAAWYQFRDARIVSKQVFFDPRPILPPG